MGRLTPKHGAVARICRPRATPYWQDLGRALVACVIAAKAEHWPSKGRSKAERKQRKNNAAPNIREPSQSSVVDCQQRKQFAADNEMPRSNTLNEKPPESLIRTWVWMLAESNDPELVERGRANLIKAFGSMQKAVQFVEQQAKNKP